MKRRLKGVPREEFEAQGAGAVALLRSSVIWPCYTAVFLFLSMDSEIDTSPLLEAALEDGKKAFAPKVCGKTLAFYSVTSAQGPWEPLGAFGIREPLGGGKAATLATLADYPTLIVVPGLAFDKSGNRLGRGGGYYDRFLGELGEERYAALGLCMDFQVLERVPAGENDKKVSWVLTQNGLIKARN